MNDLTEELLKAITEAYHDEIQNSRKIRALMGKIKKGTADYSDLQELAGELGGCLKAAFKANISDDILPDKKLLYKSALRLLDGTLKENHLYVADQAEKVQNSLNKKAGLGVKARRAEYDADKTAGIAKYISEADAYSEREDSFLNALETNSRAVVDKAVRLNAGLHSQIGLHPKIIRKTQGNLCPWCASLAGIYDYPCDRSVFKRHANCRCTVEYVPGK